MNDFEKRREQLEVDAWQIIDTNIRTLGVNGTFELLGGDHIGVLIDNGYLTIKDDTVFPADEFIKRLSNENSN